jgi:23S rRNA G2069 N7-methylase RlmK/C1962 C5-methylase RlmI
MYSPETNEKTAYQAAMLQNRLRKQFKRLHKWAEKRETNAFRLYDRDIPEIPLVLDYYDGAVAGALYKRPYEKDAAEEQCWLDAMEAAIREALPVTGVFLKQRQRQRGAAQYTRIASRLHIKNIKEGGLVFRVNLSDYLDTGLFLDRRKMRECIRHEARDNRTLNLFSYTGSFSVYAAAGGAAGVDTVDLSNTYLEWARRNFALNRLLKGRSAAYRFIRQDVRAFLRDAAREKRQWDLIILDPPGFSNSKKTRLDFDLRRDYKGLINTCAALLSASGKLWFSANTKGFAIETEAFPHLAVRDMRPHIIDEDFKERRIPACYALTPLHGPVTSERFYPMDPT